MINMAIKKIKKRDGTIEKFDKKKLTKSIASACHQANFKLCPPEVLADDILKELEKKKKDLITVEDVRSTACSVFKKNDMTGVCDTYMFVWLHSKKPKIQKVEKRDGAIEPFNSEKIFKSIQKSLHQSHIKDGKFAEKMTKEVIGILDKRFGKSKNSVPVWDIKDVIEFVLVKNKVPKVAKKYILYRYM